MIARRCREKAGYQTASNASAHLRKGGPKLRPDLATVPDSRRRNMSAVGAKNTAPELAVRRMLHGMGYRYSLHCRDLPGRPDIVFRLRRKAIEVRGCFWHRHSAPSCRNAVLPVTRREFWSAKLSTNVERDARNEKTLTRLGWDLLVIWECEARESQALAARLSNFLGPSRHHARALSPDRAPKRPA